MTELAGGIGETTQLHGEYRPRPMIQPQNDETKPIIRPEAG